MKQKKRSVINAVTRITGNLRATSPVHQSQLQLLQREIATQLLANDNAVIDGIPLQHEAVVSTADMSLNHLENLFVSGPVTGIETKKIFRRSVPYLSDIMETSVPSWASGMAVEKTFGPFIANDGIAHWFDIYPVAKLVKVFVMGNTSPILLFTTSDTIQEKRSYNIESGSVWIASAQLCNDSSLAGKYCGLKVKDGVLNFSENCIASGNDIYINPFITTEIIVTTDQPVPPASSANAGFDASDATITLPSKFTFSFSFSEHKIEAGNINSDFFGSAFFLQYSGASPYYDSGISQVVIPYSIILQQGGLAVYRISKSASELCRVSGEANIITAAWLLPVNSGSPDQLGAAAGIGSAGYNTQEGIAIEWNGLKGGSFQLNNPWLIISPGIVTVFDSAANTQFCSQKYRLWQNKKSVQPTDARIIYSDATLNFPDPSPVIFISNQAGSESVITLSNVNARLDKPVLTNQLPYQISTKKSWFMLVQQETDFTVFIFDNDIIKDNIISTKGYIPAQRSLALHNALVITTDVNSLLIYGLVHQTNEIISGTLSISVGAYRCLPTLPDPYVANYTGMDYMNPYTGFVGNTSSFLLVGTINWKPGSADEKEGILGFVFLALTDNSIFIPIPPQSSSSGVFAANLNAVARDVSASNSGTSFRNAFRTTSLVRQPLNSSTSSYSVQAVMSPQPYINSSLPQNEGSQVTQSSGLSNMEALKTNLKNIQPHLFNDEFLNRALSFASGQQNQAATYSYSAKALMINEDALRDDPPAPLITENFILLDVSTNADQMGIGINTRLSLKRISDHEVTLSNDAGLANTVSFISGFPFQAQGLDVICRAIDIHALTLPQISWEPVFNTPNPPDGSPDPLDSIAVLPGFVVFPNDGDPTRIALIESPATVVAAPLPVTGLIIEKHNSDKEFSIAAATFTLPFGMVAQAGFFKQALLDFHSPHFEKVNGGLQIKAIAPPAIATGQKPSFEGWTIQTEGLRYFVTGFDVTGSILGRMVKEIFNREFGAYDGTDKKVPLERIDFSGYGANIFSNWLDAEAAIAMTSQVKFDVMMGRTAHEIVQVRSILYPWGVHVVRTITLLRSATGMVFRSDSGWKAESDGFCDFHYKIVYGNPNHEADVPNPYTFHPGIVKGVSNVREIKDYPDAGYFTSSFNWSDLGPIMNNDSPSSVQVNYTDLGFKSATLDVMLEPVLFDADVHITNTVTKGGEEDISGSEFIVKTRKMLGYVQIAPSKVPLSKAVFSALLNTVNGPLGGPLDCEINIGNTDQIMRLTRVDVNASTDQTGNIIFVNAARGSLVLPKESSWSVVRHQKSSGSVSPVDINASVPLIQSNIGSGVADSGKFKVADPVDIIKDSPTVTTYGLLQSTGTQKLMFDTPMFDTGGIKKLISKSTYYADAYKLMNSTGIFPDVGNCLDVTSKVSALDILQEAAFHLPDTPVKPADILPPGSDLTYPFINEPGIVKIYAEYKSGAGDGVLNLGIDSLANAGQQWKAAMSNMSMVVDLGPYERIMWIDGNFNSQSGSDSDYGKPQLHLSPALQTAKDILQILEMLSGSDDNDPLQIGMTNSPDNWEYKFTASMQIPLLEFPSRAETDVALNPPLKLEASMSIGVYFNQVLAPGADLSQLMPSCGAFIQFNAQMQVLCLSIEIANVYAVGQVMLALHGDKSSGLGIDMKFGFGVELVVGLPVVLNVAVMYLAGVNIGLDTTNHVQVGAFLIYRGSASICSGLVAICIQIEGDGIVTKVGNGPTNLTAQITFAIDVTVLWVIDIEFTKTWEETRQIA